ncbi:MAG: GspE/PulE family protein [Candidatus Rifleibacteriota bacterium]
MAGLIAKHNVKKPLKDILVEKNILSQEELKQALSAAKNNENLLVEYLYRQNLVDENKLYEALADSYNLKFSENVIQSGDRDFPERLERICKRENLVIKSIVDSNITLYTCQPEKIRRFVPLFSTLGYNADFVIAPPSNFEIETEEKFNLKKHNELYKGISSLADTLKHGSEESVEEENQDISIDYEASSIVDLVNKTLLLAVKQKASDIHVESTATGARIRFRIDGVLTDRYEIDPTAASTFISRLLIMSKLDITEKVMPQDGSFKVKSENETIEFRIASMPGIYGQNLVLRLLSSGENKTLTLEDLGMVEDELTLIKEITRFPHGMILVAGPTGSGKSTTLYALLEQMSDPRFKFITIEDPVERRIGGVQQIQVRINRNEPERSLTFARGLRTVLRLDPDVIMVGEIRDADTAQISVQASLTGHLVLSTVHANSSVETLKRLENIGIDFHLLMSSLNLIFSQRLVRILCPSCKRSRSLTKKEQELLKNFSPDTVFDPAGCDICLDTGYKGRVGIFEFLPLDENLKDEIEKSGLTASMDLIRSKRLRTLLDSGLKKVAEGRTDFNEIERVCGPCR